MACEDQINTEDLINAKTDATTLGEVATSRTGAVEGGAPITTSTNRFGEVTDTVQGRLNKLGVLYDNPIRDWSASLLVSDLRAHRFPATTGDIYIPTKPLPFTTGGTFNADDWVILQGVTSGELINDLSQAYEFDTVALMVASTIVFPISKSLKTKGYYAVGTGAADYEVSVAQMADEYSDHTLTNGNVAVIQAIDNMYNLEACGGVGDGEEDDTNAINSFIAKSKAGSVRYQNRGGHDIKFPSYRRYKISSTIELDRTDANITFMNSTLEPTGAFDAVSFNGVGASLKDLDIRYEYTTDIAGIMSNKVAGVRLSGNPKEFFAETVFTHLDNISVRNAYYGIALSVDSSGSNHISIWQSKISRCRTYGCYDYGFYFRNTSSTTTTLENCHAFCRNTAPVNHGGAAILTSKGYMFYGLASVCLLNCSMDGGYNGTGREADVGLLDGKYGNVLWYFVENISIIGGFHLEGHFAVDPDARSIWSQANTLIDQFFLYSMKVDMPQPTDKFWLYGHNAQRTGRTLTWDTMEAKFEPGNITQGEYGWVDGDGLISSTLGFWAAGARIQNIPLISKLVRDPATTATVINSISSSSSVYLKVFEWDYSGDNFHYDSGSVEFTHSSTVFGDMTYTKLIFSVILEDAKRSVYFKLGAGVVAGAAYVLANDVMSLYLPHNTAPSGVGVTYSVPDKTRPFFKDYGLFDKLTIQALPGFTVII